MKPAEAVHFEVSAGKLRFYSGGLTFDAKSPFDFIVYVQGDGDLAILQGLQSERRIVASIDLKRKVARTLLSHGFRRVAWGRYRNGRPQHRVVFELARWRA